MLLRWVPYWCWKGSRDRFAPGAAVGSDAVKFRAQLSWQAQRLGHAMANFVAGAGLGAHYGQISWL